MITNNAPDNNEPQNSYAVISYLLLRQLIGVLGIGLPFFLTLGTYLFGGCSLLQPSISHYYYSIMHIVFVGTLCVLGGFLITYKGTTKSKLENRVSNCAGAFAFGVAIFPTGFGGFIGEGGSNCQFIKLTTSVPIPDYIGWLHFGFAALLFACFVIFCIKIFQEPDEKDKPVDDKKRRRNKVYKFCGIVIIISILCIAAVTIYNSIYGGDIFPYHVYVFETTSLLAFGSSWLLKGSLNWPKSKSKLVRKAIQYFR